jgi:hypothetical protein
MIPKNFSKIFKIIKYKWVKKGLSIFGSTDQIKIKKYKELYLENKLTSFRIK